MRTRTGNATIKDVAKAAGVSVGTASRVINRKASVHPKIRNAVLAAIEALNYRPNAIAQSMRSRSSHLIGCVLREINVPALAEFTRALHDVLDEAGYSLVISNSDLRPQRELEIVARLGRLQADGLVLTTYAPMNAEYEKVLSDFGGPIVIVDRDAPAWVDAVMGDHAKSIARITSRLLELGHRRILLLTGQRHLFPARERVAGYYRAFEEAGIPVDESLVRTTGFTSSDGYRHTSALLADVTPPTAIIAGGIDMLPGVLRAISVRGLNVPNDISVVAAGDSDLAELHTPPISIQRWDMAEVGRTAGHLLLRRLKDGKDAPPERVLLPTEFIERSSLAPPRKSESLDEPGNR